MENNMKLYTLNNQVFQEPLPNGFDLINAVEITSPINSDGTIINSHPDKSILEQKVDGTYYTYYNADGTPDLVKEQVDIDAKKLADAKLAKEKSLSSLTVTITSGKVFYADPNSRADLVDVVIEGILNNMPDDYQTEWKTVSRGTAPFELVTFSELKEAKRKALEAKASIIGVV